MAPVGIESNSHLASVRCERMKLGKYAIFHLDLLQEGIGFFMPGFYALFKVHGESHLIKLDLGYSQLTFRVIAFSGTFVI